MLRVGLTGGIASGKSTVAGFFAELGALVIDADRIAHRAVEPEGSAYLEVVRRFGAGVVAADGSIARERLARIVFRDPAALADLNALVHPHVRAEAERRIREEAVRGHAPIAMVDAALLVETGSYRDYHRLVVVRCSREAQLARLVARGMDPLEADARITAQAPLEDKVALADYVIDAEKTLRRTRAETEQVWHALIRDLDDMFGGPADRR